MKNAQVASVLRSKGLKVTAQRVLVCEILDGLTNHPDAEEVYQTALSHGERVPLGSIYRILGELEKHGIVRRHEFGGTRSRFELTTAAQHDHLVDTESGRVREFESKSIRDLVQQVAEAEGFELLEYELNLYCVPRKKRKET